MNALDKAWMKTKEEELREGYEYWLEAYGLKREYWTFEMFLREQKREEKEFYKQDMGRFFETCPM